MNARLNLMENAFQAILECLPKPKALELLFAPEDVLAASSNV